MNVSIYNCALNIKKKKEEKKIVNVLPSFLCVSILEDLRSIKKEVRERERKKKSLGDDLPKCVAEERRWRGPSQGCVSPCGASGAQRTPQCGAPRLLRPGSVPRRWRRERRSGAAPALGMEKKVWRIRLEPKEGASGGEPSGKNHHRHRQINKKDLQTEKSKSWSLTSLQQVSPFANLMHSAGEGTSGTSPERRNGAVRREGAPTEPDPIGEGAAGRARLGAAAGDAPRNTSEFLVISPPPPFLEPLWAMPCEGRAACSAPRDGRRRLREVPPIFLSAFRVCGRPPGASPPPPWERWAPTRREDGGGGRH